jgi:hypothetical protein
MKQNLKSHPIVQGLINGFVDWLRYRRKMHEIRNLDCRSFDDIVRDLRIASADLDAFIRRGPHAADQLPKVLKDLGIEEASLAHSEAAVLRDMQRVCVLCERKTQCNNDLEIGASARNYKDYCLNAPTMIALRQGREAQDA